MLEWLVKITELLHSLNEGWIIISVVCQRKLSQLRLSDQPQGQSPCHSTALCSL